VTLDQRGATNSLLTHLSVGLCVSVGNECVYVGIAIPDFFSNPGISGLKNANPGIPGLSP